MIKSANQHNNPDLYMTVYSVCTAIQHLMNQFFITEYLLLVVDFPGITKTNKVTIKDKNQ